MSTEHDTDLGPCSCGAWHIQTINTPRCSCGVFHDPTNDRGRLLEQAEEKACVLKMRIKYLEQCIDDLQDENSALRDAMATIRVAANW